MNARCREILRMLLESDTYLSQQQIADALQVTKRSIYYDLCRINEWLDFYHIPELEMVRGKGILISEEVRRQIEACAEEIEGDESYILSPMERVHMIICAVIYSEEPVYIDQLQDYCAVSRNTIFNDLRRGGAEYPVCGWDPGIACHAAPDDGEGREYCLLSQSEKGGAGKHEGIPADPEVFSKSGGEGTDLSLPASSGSQGGGGLQ